MTSLHLIDNFLNIRSRFLSYLIFLFFDIIFNGPVYLRVIVLTDNTKDICCIYLYTLQYIFAWTLPNPI